LRRRCPSTPSAESGFDALGVRRPLTEFLSEVTRIAPKGGKPGDVTVRSPFEASGAQQIAREGPLAGQVAYAEVELPSDSIEKAAASTECRRGACSRRSR